MLRQKNWSMFPLARRQKMPEKGFDDWASRASSDPKKLKAWANKYKNCNWALLPSKSGLVVVDVDREGLPYWKEWCREFGEPKTLKAISGARGGYHYVFLHEEGRKYRGKISSKIKIDIQYNNYIVVEPSIVARPYKWVNKVKPQPVPEWLLKKIIRTRKEKKTVSNDDFDREFFEAIALELKDKPLDYREWLDLGMGLHYASQGSDEGLEVWLEITGGVNYVSGDEDLAARKWDGFDCDEDEDAITGGTVVQIAKDKGCTIPRNVPKPHEIFDNEGVALSNPNELTSWPNMDKWELTGDQREYTKELPVLIDRLTRMGFATLTGEKEGTIIRTYKDEHNILNYTEVSLAEFGVATGHLAWLKKDEDDEDGGGRIIDAATAWKRSNDKRRYRGIYFSPNQKKGYLNLWSRNPIPCTPMKGDISVILEYIEKILCRGSRPRAKYLIQWLAHMIQKPEEKPSVAIIMTGREGAGKGFLTDKLMRGILHSRFTLVDTREDIKNKFNKDLAFKFLIAIDEASWKGDNELMGILRSRTGNKTLRVEEKYSQRYTVEDYARIMVLANNNDPIKIQATNRRWLVYENSDKYHEDPIYNELYDGVEIHHFAEKFYHHLLNVDIDDFYPYKFPKVLDTEGVDLKLSDDIFREFLYDFLVESPEPIFCPRNGLIRKSFYEHFMGYADSVKTWKRQVSQRGFWVEIEKIAPIVRGKNKPGRLGDSLVRFCRVTPTELCDSFVTTLNLGHHVKLYSDESAFFLQNFSN